MTGLLLIGSTHHCCREEQKYQKLMAERIRAAKSVLPKAASPSKRKAATPREAPVPADASPQQPVPAADQSLMQHSMSRGGSSSGRQPTPQVPLRYRYTSLTGS